MHMHSHNHSSDLATVRIKTAFFLNLSFTIIEFIGGVLTNSVAIMSDALHDLGDTLSLGLSWYLEKVAGKGKNSKYSFGYRRFSLLGALINGIVLIIGSFIILYEAIPRLISPEGVHVKGMIFLAILGILVNGAAVIRLQGGKSLNEKVVSWHLLEDVFGWVVVLIISIVMMFWKIPILDPILSICITSFVLWNVFKRLKETLEVLLQSVPANIDINNIENKIIKLQGVDKLHDTHIWSLDGDKHIMSIHIVISNDFKIENSLQIKERIRNICKEENINHVTIEVETSNEDCPSFECC